MFITVAGRIRFVAVAGLSSVSCRASAGAAPQPLRGPANASGLSTVLLPLRDSSPFKGIVWLDHVLFDT